MGVAATAVGLSGGIVVGGAAAAGVIGLKALAKNSKSVPDNPRQLKRIQTGLLKKWAIIARDNPDNMAAFDACQTPLRDVLSECSVDPKTLAEIIRNPDQPDFPSSATHYVLARIAVIDTRFAAGIERQFAAAVIEAGFEAAIEDRAYFEALEPHLLLGVARDVAETKRNTEVLKDGQADILSRLDAAKGGMSKKTHNRAIRILNDESTDDMSDDEIVVQVLNRLTAFEKVQALKESSDNLGEDFTKLAESIDALLDEDDGAQAAITRLDEALQTQRDKTTHLDAINAKIYDLAIQTAIAVGDSEKAAEYELERIGSPKSPNWYNELYKLEQGYFQKGKVSGARLPIRIAAVICSKAADIAETEELTAALKNSEAIAWAELGIHGDNDALRLAIKAYQHASRIFTKKSSPVFWAMIQNNLGNLFVTLSDIGVENALEHAFSSFENALQIRTREEMEEEWATTNNNLGNAFTRLGKRGDSSALYKAIEVYEQALEVRTSEDSQDRHIQTLNNLANVLSILGGLGSREALLKSIDLGKRLRSICDVDDFPIQWTAIQIGLAINYRILWEKGYDDNAYTHAFVAYNSCLEIYAREEISLHWLHARNGIGLMQLQLGLRGSSDDLIWAQKSFELMLQFFSKDERPFDWAMAKHNLGTCFFAIGQKGDLNALSKAELLFEDALTVRRRGNLMLEWAITRECMGHLYLYYLQKTSFGGNKLNLCIEAYRDALSVYSHNDHPEEHARISRCLAAAIADQSEV